jgi:hypothetical protein
MYATLRMTAWMRLRLDLSRPLELKHVVITLRSMPQQGKLQTLQSIRWSALACGAQAVHELAWPTERTHLACEHTVIVGGWRRVSSTLQGPPHSQPVTQGCVAV